MQDIKQSTATTVYVGPVLDSAGAAVTTAVVGDFKLVKNGTVATLSGAIVTHDANGYYTIALTTGNTDTTGRLTIGVGNTAMSMSTHRYSVLLPSVFDALYTNATNTTGGLPTATGAITALSGAVSTFAGGPVQSVTNRVTANVDQWNGVTVTGMPMPTYAQPTGFLTATFPATVASPTNITQATGVVLAAQTHTGAVIPTVTAVTNAVALPSSATINITGNLTGNVTGSVGSVTGAVGSVSSFGSLVSDITNSVWSATSRTLSAAGVQAIWDALTSALSTAGSIGKLLVDNINATIGSRATQTSVDLKPTLTQIEGSTVLAMASQVPTAAQNASAVWAASGRTLSSFSFQVTVGGYAVGQAPLQSVSDIKDAVASITPISDLATMIINDGTANARYSVSSLQNAPTGGGGAVINVYPVSASTPERVNGTTLTFYRNESRSVSVATDFNLEAMTMQFVVEDTDGTNLLVVDDGSISKSGVTFTVGITSAVTSSIGNYKWSARDITTGNSVIARGVLSVQEAASV